MLAPVQNMTKNVVLDSRGISLTLTSTDEEDFYPNLFWAEIKSDDMPDSTDIVEAYDLTDFQLLNPSSLRYYFVLDIVPIGKDGQGPPIFQLSIMVTILTHVGANEQGQLKEVSKIYLSDQCQISDIFMVE